MMLHVNYTSRKEGREKEGRQGGGWKKAGEAKSLTRTKRATSDRSHGGRLPSIHSMVWLRLGLGHLLPRPRRKLAMLTHRTPFLAHTQRHSEAFSSTDPQPGPFPEHFLGR